MSLDALITVTGLEKHILRHDLHCAVHRYQITRDDREMEDLTRDQHLMYLVLVGAVKGDPLWTKIEEHLGETLPA